MQQLILKTLRPANIFRFAMMVVLFQQSDTRAHELGAPFSDAIIDPLSLHHAHIEDEQRINLFMFRGLDGESGTGNSYEGELELAYATHDFRYGFEFFIPFGNIPSPNGDGRETGVGDIEVRPIKYALFAKPDFIVSTASAILLPTGDKQRGLGEGNTAFTQFLFMDKAFGNWFLGANFALSTNVTGETESSFEYGGVLSYSFIRDTRGWNLAKAPPTQRWIVSPSVELVGESAFRGAVGEREAVSIIPGLTVWDRRSGWQLHIGAQLPLTDRREAEQIFLIQLGNHFNWGALLGRKSGPE